MLIAKGLNVLWHRDTPITEYPLKSPTTSSHKLRRGSLTTSLSGALFLSFEYFLQLSGKSLCKTSACKIVSSYLIIPETLVISVGAAYFWVLFCVIFLIKSYPRFLGPLAIFLVVFALTADGTLIGFQFFTIKQWCTICFTTASLILLTSFLYIASIKKDLFPFLVICLWFVPFLTFGIIKMPTPQSSFYNMAFYSQSYHEDSQRKAPRITFFFSLTCKHCAQVVSYLKENLPNNVEFRLASIDTTTQLRTELSYFLQDVESGSTNIFLELEKHKDFTIDTGIMSETEMTKQLSTQTQNALNYLTNNGIKTVPVLLVEKSMNEKQLLTGSKAILDFLQSSEFISHKN